MKSRREILLAAIFGGLILVFGLWDSIGAIILQPLSDSRVAVAAARANLAKLHDQSMVIEQSMRNLKTLKSQGLPADPATASVQYQGWLIRQLELAAIESPVVSPGPPIVEDAVGYRIPFVVQFAADSASLAGFLDGFNSTPLLHRITNLHVVRSTDQSDHRVMLSIEVLAMDSSLATQSIPDPIPGDQERTLSSVIAMNDFFGGSDDVDEPMEPLENSFVAVDNKESDPEPAVIAPPRQALSALESVRFIASVWNGRQRQAWLVDSRSNQEITVTESSELTLPGIEGRVLSIENDSLQLILNHKHYRIDLGQTLHEARSLLTTAQRPR